METAVKWNETAVEFGFRGLEHFCAEALVNIEAGSASPALADLLNGHVDDHSKNLEPGL